MYIRYSSYEAVLWKSATMTDTSHYGRQWDSLQTLKNEKKMPTPSEQFFWQTHPAAKKKNSVSSMDKRRFSIDQFQMQIKKHDSLLLQRIVISAYDLLSLRRSKRCTHVPAVLLLDASCNHLS